MINENAQTIYLCPDECAMYPNTEKITKPAQKLVAELMKLVSKASLKTTNENKEKKTHIIPKIMTFDWIKF